MCVVAPGGGACMVASGVCVHGYSGGACMVAPGGHVWLLWGACVVAPDGGRGSRSGGLRPLEMLSRPPELGSKWPGVATYIFSKPFQYLIAVK